MLLVMCSAVCRDIGGSDPERMAAPRVCDYVHEVFKNTCIKVMLLYALGMPSATVCTVIVTSVYNASVHRSVCVCNSL